MKKFIRLYENTRKNLKLNEEEELKDPDTSQEEEDIDNLEKANELIVKKFIKDYNEKLDYYTKQIKKIGMHATLKNFIDILIDSNIENPALKMFLSLDMETALSEIEELLKSKLADKIVKKK